MHPPPWARLPTTPASRAAAAALDGEALPTESGALRDAVSSAPAVGRISPEGKRAVVAALAGAGRYVAMVGDGVNDVPALKQARLAIAQGSGAQMSRSVADLVLVRDDFDVVPGMVAEGRQILRNIQRVARLFITKTVFTAVVGLAVAIPTATFPLLPRQFTIAATVTIGIPALRARARAELRAVATGALHRVCHPLRDPGRQSVSESESSPATCSHGMDSTLA